MPTVKILIIHSKIRRPFFPIRLERAASAMAAPATPSAMSELVHFSTVMTAAVQRLNRRITD
jgi:hypothetical protein